MDAKEINEKSKALMKATQAGESPSIIIGILKELKTGVVASEDVLRSTKIGVTVNKSKIHKNPEVARLAAEIVRKWRDDIAKQKGISTTPANAKPGRSTPKRGTASPAPTFEKSKPTSTAPSVPPDQRTWKKDKIDTAKTGQATRDSCIGLMYDGLVHLSTAPSSTVLNMAIAVEQAMYKAHGPEDKPSYKEKIRSLYQNLKAKNNPGLRLKIMSGEITPEKFVVMTSQELKSETLKAEEAKLQKENMNNARVPQEEKSISTALRCSKCGQKKVSYTQAQTRSADEPMTTFCECVVCGNRWKFS